MRIAIAIIIAASAERAITIAIVVEEKAVQMGILINLGEKEEDKHRFLRNIHICNNKLRYAKCVPEFVLQGSKRQSSNNLFLHFYEIDFRKFIIFSKGIRMHFCTFGEEDFL